MEVIPPYSLSVSHGRQLPLRSAESLQLRHFAVIPSSLGRERWHELHLNLVWYVKHLAVLLPAIAVTLMAGKRAAHSSDPLRPYEPDQRLETEPEEAATS